MSALRILVACEFSGLVRSAFTNRGGGGRMSDLSISNASLGRDATTGARLDHPRLNRRFLLKNALLHTEGADRISSDLHRLEPVVCHRARPQRGLVEYVAFGFWPFLQILDRVSHTGDLAHQVLTFLQIDRFVEGSSCELSIGCPFGPDRGDWSYHASDSPEGPNEHP